VKIRRTIPPVGYRVALSNIVQSALAPTSGERLALEESVRAHFGAASAHAVGSGKAALVATLRSLHALTGRTKVIVPAYTCYSLPSAIMKAGLVPLPCDIGADSFDYDYDALGTLLTDDVLCALSVHLFGIASDTDRLRVVCEPHGIFVVEDAAQAMGIHDNGALLGSRGDVGFFSFGRGKNLTCGSGGIVLTRRRDIASSLADVIRTYTVPPAADDFRTLATLLGMLVFLSPQLYWLPAGIPSLQLGETFFHEDFPLTRLSDVQARILRNWAGDVVSLNAGRTLAGRYYHGHLVGVRTYGSDVPYIRFPVLLEHAAARERVVEEGRRWGIVRMYPDTLAAIPQVRPLLSSFSYPHAERVAATLVTLPTHPLMSERDRAAVCAIVSDQPRMR
jgi:dTDP-4-amino-4,6-dideoxygalactose transaminase